MAQAGQCKGTEFPIAGKCTRALGVHPDGFLLGMGNRIVVFFFSAVFILLYLDCLGHYVAKKLYGGSKARIMNIRTIVCLLGFVSFATILVARTDEYAESGIKGLTFFTIFFMIHLGTTLATIAFITMDYVDRTLARDGDMRANVGYTKTTKIVCILFLVLAVFQVSFYAGVAIKYLGKKPEWVRATHYVTMGINVVAICVASLMFFVGQMITSYGIKSIRSKATSCVTWANLTILACGINIYVVAYYHFATNAIPPHLPKVFADLIKLQQELTPYIMTNLLLPLSACLQHYANVCILMSESGEIYSGASTIKWIRHFMGTPYKFDVVVASTDDRNTSTYNRNRTGTRTTRTQGNSSTGTTTDEGGLESVKHIESDDIEVAHKRRDPKSLKDDRRSASYWVGMAEEMAPVHTDDSDEDDDDDVSSNDGDHDDSAGGGHAYSAPEGNDAV